MREVFNQRKHAVLNWTPGLRVRSDYRERRSAMDYRDRRRSYGVFRRLKAGRTIKLGYSAGVALGVVIAAYYGGV